MTCREAQKLVMPYINKEISDEDLAEFLKHIDSCEECREELEIYFTVDVGIRQLEEGTGTWSSPDSISAPSICSRPPGTQ